MKTGVIPTNEIHNHSEHMAFFTVNGILSLVLGTLGIIDVLLG